jgi:hypothetical protein
LFGRKPKFPCNIYSGDHLTHLCPGLLEAWRLWSLSISAYDSYSYEVSSQPIERLVDELVTVMQSSIEPTPLLGVDAPLDHVVSQFIHSLFDEVIILMQSSTDPTLLFGGDFPSNHVVS